LEPEVEKDRTEAESESSNNEICCRTENRVLVDDLKTIQPESETDDDSSETKSERSREGVCCQVGNSLEDSEAPISASESNSDKLDIDFEHSRYKECYRVKYRVLLDLYFCSQK